MKYYFGYFSYNGKIFPSVWIEEGGQVIGGVSTPLMRQEVSEEQFKLPLSELQELFPLPTLPE